MVIETIPTEAQMVVEGVAHIETVSAEALRAEFDAVVAGIDEAYDSMPAAERKAHETSGMKKRPGPDDGGMHLRPGLPPSLSS